MRVERGWERMERQRWVEGKERKMGGRQTHTHTHLWVSEVDLHDESNSDSCGKGEAGCDDDSEAISLAGTALR